MLEICLKMLQNSIASRKIKIFIEVRILSSGLLNVLEVRKIAIIATLKVMYACSWNRMVFLMQLCNVLTL
jgi:hypothetical protein